MRTPRFKGAFFLFVIIEIDILCSDWIKKCYVNIEMIQAHLPYFFALGRSYHRHNIWIFYLKTFRNSILVTEVGYTY